MSTQAQRQKFQNEHDRVEKQCLALYERFIPKARETLNQANISLAQKISAHDKLKETLAVLRAILNGPFFAEPDMSLYPMEAKEYQYPEGPPGEPDLYRDTLIRECGTEILPAGSGTIPNFTELSEDAKLEALLYRAKQFLKPRPQQDGATPPRKIKSKKRKKKSSSKNKNKRYRSGVEGFNPENEN